VIDDVDEKNSSDALCAFLNTCGVKVGAANHLYEEDVKKIEDLLSKRKDTLVSYNLDETALDDAQKHLGRYKLK